VSVKLSIAICTYRRPDDLRECLRALRDLGYARAHEVLVVENSDRGEDRAVTERLVRECEGARLLTSAPPGLSRARNVALGAATGDVIAFLDDDATALAGWAEALLAAFEDPGVAIAGGPILPRWETPPPEWLDGELLLSLAVQDRGPIARDLREDEFLYGANVAFRREALAAAGGFAEHLGRSGTDLMGDEEIEVQRRLRTGGRSRHVPGARVHHLMQRERCTLQWFLKRYAWQGLSDARTGDPGTLAWLGTLVAQEGPPSARAFVDDLLAAPPRSTEDVVGRARLVRGLVSALLDDRVPVARSAGSAEPARAPSIDDPEFHFFKTEVPGGAQILFVEFGVSHSFLFEAYGRIEGATFVNPKLDPSTQPFECARFLDDAVFYASRSGVRTVVLLTADVLTWPGFERALTRPTAGVEVFGFLHRSPADAAGEARLRLALEKLTGMFVFSEATRRHAEAQFGAKHVTVVPLPPTFLANARPLEPRRWGSGDVVRLGLLGEVRRGKGYEFAVSALASSPAATRGRVKLVMAGRVDEQVERFIRDKCAGASLATDLNLSTNSERGYRAIPDNVFARAVAATDVMVFPFERDHWNVQSAHFADALLAGSWILASAGTLIGDLVERHQLGRTFEYGNDASLLDALDALLREVEAGTAPQEGRQRIAEAHSVVNASRAVEEILRGGAAASPRAAAGSGRT
jgi:GT2 family glycosyltransferase/glycosyltransferase involved in cell wall biosynthesis